MQQVDITIPVVNLQEIYGQDLLHSVVARGYAGAAAQLPSAAKLLIYSYPSGVLYKTVTGTITQEGLDVRTSFVVSGMAEGTYTYNHNATYSGRTITRYNGMIKIKPAPAGN